MADKMICPACDSYSSSVLQAFRHGSPCPWCDLSAIVAAEDGLSVNVTTEDDDDNDGILKQIEFTDIEGIVYTPHPATPREHQENKKIVSTTSYDSRADTLIHSQRVGELVVQLVKELLDRSTCHDRSKTKPPEVAIFDEYTPKLASSTYGSDGYKQLLAGMGDGLTHHYQANRHHPEHFPDGVNDMTLVDVVEMLADWKAATERHDDGDLSHSLTVNQERFGLSDQLTRILRNTAEHLGWATGNQHRDRAQTRDTPP